MSALLRRIGGKSAANAILAQYCVGGEQLSTIVMELVGDKATKVGALNARRQIQLRQRLDDQVGRRELVQGPQFSAGEKTWLLARCLHPGPTRDRNT